MTLKVIDEEQLNSSASSSSRQSSADVTMHTSPFDFADSSQSTPKKKHPVARFDSDEGLVDDYAALEPIQEEPVLENNR